MKEKLTKREQKIEDALDVTGRQQASDKRLGALQSAARDTKTERINIRIVGDDLQGLKDEAGDLGIPYQTFIASVLHQYVTGRLIDSKANGPNRKPKR